MMHFGQQQFQDRWYQIDAVQSVFDYFNARGYQVDEKGKPIEANPVLALPTASGKTIVIARLIQRILQMFPRQRFLVVTHVQELIEQNADKFGKIWPHAPMGVYSAGLKSRDFMQPVIFGGVQSMVGNAELFGHRDIMIIDEAHLVSPKEGSEYQELIRLLRLRNPWMRVIGLSATIYRMGMGLITSDVPGRIFTDICYDLTTMDSFARLIAEGYLSPIYAKNMASAEIDLSGVGRTSNEFNLKQLQEASNKEKVTFKALQEACNYGVNRRSWIAFAAGIEHAENIAAMLNRFGVSATAVHSKMKDPKERDRRINAHKRGEVRCLVGNNIFTTGYDHPPLDFLIDLQATMSTPKHVQKYG